MIQTALMILGAWCAVTATGLAVMGFIAIRVRCYDVAATFALLVVVATCVSAALFGVLA